MNKNFDDEEDGLIKNSNEKKTKERVGDRGGGKKEDEKKKEKEESDEEIPNIPVLEDQTVRVEQPPSEAPDLNLVRIFQELINDIDQNSQPSVFNKNVDLKVLTSRIAPHSNTTEDFGVWPRENLMAEIKNYYLNFVSKTTEGQNKTQL